MTAENRTTAWLVAILTIVGPVLMLASVPLDPPPTGPDPRGTIESYTLHPERMDLAATLLHNGFLLFGLGLFVAGLLVPGRGRALAVAGGLLGGIGFTKMAGTVFTDWTGSAAGRVVGVDAALRIDEAVPLPGLLAGWLVPQTAFAVLGPLLLLLGAARARLLPWWAAVLLPAAAVATTLAVTGPLGTTLFFGVQLAVGVALAASVRGAGTGSPLPGRDTVSQRPT